MYPSISELFAHHNAVYGIVYDIGDFPGELMLSYPHDTILLNGHIVLFKQFSDFLNYYRKAAYIEDLNLAFTCQAPLEEIKNAFENFYNICGSRVNFEKIIVNILHSKLNATIYVID